MKFNNHRSPLVSVLLLCYNQEDYVEYAVKGLLSQTYENIEFILSDDCSSDKTFENLSTAVSTLSQGKTIKTNRNEKNLGLVKHFNKILAMASGDVIILAAGDDFSYQDRVSDTVTLLENNNIFLVSFNDDLIDSSGQLYSAGHRVKFNGNRRYTLNDLVEGKKIPLSGASRGFKRDLYEVFGNLNSECPTEDTPYVLRAFLLGDVLISSKVAIQYRVHEKSLSSIDNIHKLDVDRIAAQYEEDLKVAMEKGLINSSQLQSIKAWSKKVQERRKLVNRVYKEKLSFSLLYSLALCHLIKPREKLYLFKILLKRELL